MADNTNRIAGTAYFSIDGVRYALVGEYSYRPASPQRESKMGSDGWHGYKEKPQQGQIKAKLRDGRDVSVAEIGQMTNSTIVAELANGKTIVGRNMFCVEPPVADAEEAEIELTFEGPDVSEN